MGTQDLTPRGLRHPDSHPQADHLVGASFFLVRRTIALGPSNLCTFQRVLLSQDLTRQAGKGEGQDHTPLATCLCVCQSLRQVSPKGVAQWTLPFMEGRSRNEVHGIFELEVLSGLAQQGSETCSESHSKLRTELDFRLEDAHLKVCSSLSQLLPTESDGGLGKRLE